MNENLFIIIGAVLVTSIGIIYATNSPSDDTTLIKEPRSANKNVSDYRKNIISNYWEEKYPGTQSGGSKRKRKNKKPKNKTKKH